MEVTLLARFLARLQQVLFTGNNSLFRFGPVWGWWGFLCVCVCVCAKSCLAIGVPVARPCLSFPIARMFFPPGTVDHLGPACTLLFWGVGRLR